MGTGRYSESASRHITEEYKTKPVEKIFVNTKIAPELNPHGLKFREARDSAAHPESYPIAIFLDDTGSMGSIPAYLIQNKLPNLMEIIIKHGTEHPAVMFSAIGDQFDEAPLQIGQFESSEVELNKCLSSIWLEGHGRGGAHEAYLLAWLIADRHVSMDAYEKRGQKGILFTIGDEMSHPLIQADKLKQIMGYSECEDVNDKELLEGAQRMFHVFHIHVEQGSYPSTTSQGKEVVTYWKDRLIQNLIICEDKDEIAELIGATVAMIHGADLATVVKDMSAKTGENVTKALAKIDLSLIHANQKEGVLAV